MKTKQLAQMRIANMFCDYAVDGTISLSRINCGATAAILDRFKNGTWTSFS